VLLILTPFDTEEGYRRLSAALREMDGMPELGGGETGVAEVPGTMPKTLPRKVMEIAKAREENHRLIRVEEAEGKTAGEYITVYPPGQPLLVPGEVLEKEHIELLLSYRKNGFSLQGVETDEKGQMLIRVTENKNL